MTISNMSDSDYKQSCAVISDTMSETRQANDQFSFHFLNDTKAKFILTSDGEVLSVNHLASNLLSSGILRRLPSGKLSYGSTEMNEQVDDILKLITRKRSTYQRLLKRLQDENWAVLEFSAAEFSTRDEVLLTISQKDLCNDKGLQALAKTFAFTITETEVVRYMAKAYCPKEISSKMGITTNTVRAHLRSIYSKTGMRGYNRALELSCNCSHKVKMSCTICAPSEVIRLLLLPHFLC